MLRGSGSDIVYDDGGRLASVSVSLGTAVLDDDGDGLPDGPLPSAPLGGTLVSSLQYDLLGRQVGQSDYGGVPGFAGATFSRSITYNAKNQIVVDDSSTVRLRTGTAGNDSWRTITRNDYDGDGNLGTGGGSTYALGAIVWQHGETFKNDATGDIDDVMTRFDYSWWDGAVQASIAYDKHYGWSNNNGPSGQFNLGNFTTNFTTNYSLNELGQTVAATVQDGVPKSLGYTLDAGGQIIRRTEMRLGNTSQAAPRELFYRFGGLSTGSRQMGMVGNNGTDDVGYSQSIAARSAASPNITDSTAGLFRNGTNTGSIGYADFSQSIDPFNSNYQGSAGGGSYTVRSGDTLQAIAASLYGDANLWYRLAEANGLSAQSSLTEGTSLILPANSGDSLLYPQLSLASPYSPSCHILSASTARKAGDTQ